MWRTSLLVTAWIVMMTRGEEHMPTVQEAADAEMRLSERIRIILEHYKKPDPVGIPGLNIPDPFPVPDMTRTVAMSTMNMKDLRLYGLSHFRVDYIETDLAKMEVSAGVQIGNIHIEGNYTMRYFLTTSHGIFNISLEDVYTQGNAKMIVGPNGKLQADNIDMYMSYSNMHMDLENEALSGFVKGLIVSMAPFIFEGVKPYILKELNKDIRADINKQVSELPHKFPNSIQPLDYMFSDARRLVQFMGYDPYKLPDYNYSVGMTGVELSHTWVMGLASFYRVGDIKIGFEKHVMHAGLELGTLRLGGRCHWKVSTLLGYLTRAGAAQFTVEYVQVFMRVSQPLDTRHHPKLDRFDVKLGDFQIRVEGTGTLDYVIELVANVLPNLLRYQIMTAIETKIRTSIQEALDRVDMEEVINERLEQMDRMEES